MLNNGSQGVGFYKLASGSKLGAYKAYLRYDGGGAGARAFIGFDEATALGDAMRLTDNGELTMDGEIYDLQGRRVKQPARGLYVKNGKKVVIK